ncbi:hypothetical protein GGR55DRAFT_27045 [Xylaria sp. FL0064]|nr:hypothetical protein GGR55DRAFT_27045 [Xylaria sp. FL0064]
MELSIEGYLCLAPLTSNIAGETSLSGCTRFGMRNLLWHILTWRLGYGSLTPNYRPSSKALLRSPRTVFFFRPGGGVKQGKTNRFVDIFKREGCDRLSDSYAISGNITADLLSASLRQSNLSTADLRGPELPVLCFPKGTHVSCLYGKHRIEALRRSIYLSLWWTVKLYIVPNQVISGPCSFKQAVTVLRAGTVSTFITLCIKQCINPQWRLHCHLTDS